MKAFVIGVMALLLAACAQTTLPTSNNVTDWQVFGKQSALDGLRELSEERIAKLDDVNHATAELIMAYQAGYQQGKQEYCEQSAYMLGVIGRPYFGICDDVDPFFQHDYDAGRMSSAGAPI
ncbi:MULTISPECIES: DUF2799 domain-containing protein [Vibrio]|uniref:DUF2799 domain-containing protein n=1 Tax=Vibrio TaxID=662 RepID=UPI000803B6DF|nr:MULTISPECIES: DUF2799 domain-containing protein [Vibrio]ANP63557.1 hypothetical protein BAU10_00565 [Vibrio alginolyticus]MBO0136386.1 DUF2799 domain-containing protein [Vibrio sp. Vb2736]MBO0163006.1 DUF2799 domain-containing protein [Vibrio alginolyticus]MBS9824420.1 DUF2799 domain-containing protein [Vibrio alginolyticus]MBS9902464.1 DUF2799 domain-containing protein [Vibrio alginolyticus]